MAFEAGSAVVRVTGDISDFKSKIEDVKKTGAGLADALRPVGAALTAIGTAGALAIGLATKEAIAAQSEIARLTALTQNAAGASQEQIDALVAQADALERVGVVSAGAIVTAQGQLATFDLSTEAIYNLIPALTDMAVAEYGTAISAEQLKSVANGLGKALQGQTDLLTKQGFQFDEATKSILENGTEQERVAAITEILNSTYEGLNETMAQTAEGQLANLTNQFNALAGDIGVAFLPILQQVITTVQPLVEQLRVWIAENPKLATQIAMVAGVVTVLAGVLGPILLLLPGIMAAMSAVGAVITFVTTTAFLPIVAAIVAIIAIGYLLIKHWDTVKAAASAVGDWLAGVWNTIVNAVTTFLQFVVDLFMMYIDMWIAIITFGLAFILGLFGTNFAEVQAGLKDFWTTVTALFQKAIDFIKMIWEFWWKAMVAFYGPIVMGVVNTVTSLWEGIKSLFSGGGDAIAKAWSGVWEGIKNVAQTVGNAVIGVVKNIINAIIEKINGFISAVNKVAQAGAVGGLKVPTIPSIPMLAKGGIVTRPTLAMIGEAGPEAVVPLNSSNTPGVGGGMTINIYDPMVRDDNDFGRLGELIRNTVGRDLETSRLGVTR